jgi:hypothetical protein
MPTKTYLEANREKVNAQRRKWRAANPEKIAAQNKRWREANPEKCRAIDKERWKKADKAKHRLDQNKWNFENKIKVLTHYGKDGKLQCCWSNCCETDIDCLTLDHINNNGARDRKFKRRTGVILYASLIASSYPEGFQTLCSNHNLKKALVLTRQLLAEEALRSAA